MVSQAIAYIETIIQAYGAWGVFLATLVEEMVAPIPSALVPVAAGFFLVPAEALFPEALMLSVLTVAIPVALGVTIGASAIYAIAYAGGKPIVERFGKWFGLTWESVERMQKKFSGGRRDEATLFLLRLIPVVPGVGISGFAGTVRYPFIPFALITLVATFLRSIALSLLGWQAGELYQEYFELIDRIEGYLLFGLIAIVALAVGIHFARKRTRS